MQVHETIEGFRKALDAERVAGRTVGLVPTMGYLHDGHASLIRRSAAECDVTAATIFINPLQFAASEDLSTYPRDLESDKTIAEASGVDHLFTPSTSEMYPDEVLTSVAVAKVSEGMEGASRPGHFDGVSTVVAKLFNIAGACRAYFGEKDWQQLAVVRRMVHDLSFPVDVVASPTVREADGLAMSSRNAYLDAEQRLAAPVVYKALVAGRDALAAGADAVAEMTAVIEREPLAALDYAAATEDRLCIAVRIGATRLIDNIGV